MYSDIIAAKSKNNFYTLMYIKKTFTMAVSAEANYSAIIKTNHFKSIQR